MRIIVEKWDGAIYVYRETEKQFKRNERHRKGPVFTGLDLAEDCNMASYPPNCHLVFKVKK